MKFFQLPIGARFEYRGEVYRKSGPLVATREVGGAQQLMMRSANVKPESSEAEQGSETAPGESLPADRVEAAFRDFYQACEQLLAESSGAQTGTQQEELLQRLRTHRQRFFAQIKRSEETR
jgi:hypothetical protein